MKGVCMCDFDCIYYGHCDKEIECENHSAVSKRLKRIYQDYEEFKKEYQKRKR